MENQAKKIEENNEGKEIVVNGEVNEEMLEKLSRSIIGESLHQVNIDVMAEKLRREWLSIVGVKKMGRYKTDHFCH